MRLVVENTTTHNTYTLAIPSLSWAGLNEASVTVRTSVIPAMVIKKLFVGNNVELQQNTAALAKNKKMILQIK